MKSKIVKKIIPVSLAGALLVGQSLPTFAQTMDMTTVKDIFAMSSKAQEYPFTYEINEDGAGVTITGLPTDYSGKLEIPSEIDNLPVTSIGRYAFVNCVDLENVIIPDSVVSIEYYAFGFCESIKSITIPDSVKTIGICSFSNCTGLKSISIPSGITDISNNAFYLCSNLESVKISDTVTSIGKGVFDYCAKLENITISKDNKNYSSEDGVLYNKDKSEIIKYPSSKADKTFALPNTVTNIIDKAFEDCIYLENVTMPDSLTTIGEYSFRNCISLTSIVIPHSVEIVGRGSFYGCRDIKSITIEDGVKTIDDGAFQICSSLVELYIPDSLTDIREYVFFNCRDLKSITVSENNPNYVSEDGVLYNKDKTVIICYPVSKADKTFTIPNSVTSVLNLTFSDCNNLTQITIPDHITDISTGMFSKCQNLNEVNFSKNTTSIGNHAFANCKSLITLDIPNSVTSIGTRAFFYCKNLESITIPKGVTLIEDGTFAGCSNLKSVTILDNVQSIASDAFDECDNLTIYGYEGSYAQTYANENSIDFVVIQPAKLGDVDEDGIISAMDATLLARFLTSNDKNSITKYGLINADVTQDEEINLEDLVKLKKYIVKPSGAIE